MKQDRVPVLDSTFATSDDVLTSTGRSYPGEYKSFSYHWTTNRLQDAVPSSQDSQYCILNARSDIATNMNTCSRKFFLERVQVSKLSVAICDILSTRLL
jgi:hypothetical protein